MPVIVVSMIVGMSSCGKDDDGSSSVPQRPSGGNQADSIAIAGIQWQEREIHPKTSGTLFPSRWYRSIAALPTRSTTNSTRRRS